MSRVVSTDNTQGDEVVSWSAYHASLQPTNGVSESSLTKTSLLPLFYDRAHSVAMIRHSMNVVKKAVDILNPGQVPIITVDQPLFTIAKQIQWNWTASHGEDQGPVVRSLVSVNRWLRGIKTYRFPWYLTLVSANHASSNPGQFIVMFGGLHIEMAAFKTIGNLLDSSGWTGALVQANVATPGTAESFLCVTHMTRTRQAHQITVSSLYHLLQKGYLAYCSSLGEESNQSPLADWCSSRAELYPQFKFWLLILQLELAVLV